MTKLVAQSLRNSQQIAAKFPNIMVFVDVCKEGAGNTVYSLTNAFESFTFRVAFLDKIQQTLEAQTKENTKVTNSDLETLGYLIAFLVVATDAPVKDLTLKIFYNNTPVVEWAQKLLAKSARIARLV